MAGSRDPAIIIAMNIQNPIARATGEPPSQYDADFYVWALAQSDALARRDAAALDWDNLAEEIGDLGKSHLLEMENRLVTIMEHLLKYEFGVMRDPARKWMRTIVVQKTDLARHLRSVPSLAARVEEIAREAYPDARRKALAGFEYHESVNLPFYSDALPKTLPYDAAMLLDPDVMPEPRD